MKKRNIEVNPKGLCVLIFAALAVLCVAIVVHRFTGEIHLSIVALVIVFFASLIDIVIGLTRYLPDYARRKK